MIITRTPLRISFCGGGSDFPAFYWEEEGAVVSTTIDKYVYIVVNPKFDGRIRASYSKTEIVDRVDDLQHELIRESLKMVGIEGGIEIVSVSDIPSEGSGLGSSSAYTVGLLNALGVYKGAPTGAGWLAGDACEIEIGRCGRPIGKQDQYAVAYGGLNRISFDPIGQVFVEPIDCPAQQELQARLMLFYTGLTRNADEILSAQVRNISEKRDIFRLKAALAHQMREALVQGELDKFGNFIHEDWMLKRELAEGITNSAIDWWYAKARDCGAIGGKILGAGGGGFLMLYAHQDFHEDIMGAMPELVHVPFSFVNKGSEVIYAD